MMNEKSAQAFWRLVESTYSNPSTVNRYRERALRGLAVWEQSIIAKHFSSGAQVLAIGCGAGREVFALEDLGFDMCGTDISQPLLSSAVAIAAERRSRAKFTLSNGQLLSYRDEAFDVVTLWSQVLANVPTAELRLGLLREAHRVLKPGGLVTFSVHDRERTLPLVDAATIVSTGPDVGDLIMLSEDQNPCYWHYFDHEEVRRLCFAAGFQALNVCHTSDLGQSWGNVFVVVATK